MHGFALSLLLSFSIPGSEIVNLVRDRFLDAGKAAAWAERHAGYADAIRDPEAFRDETRRLLAELETSHTQYYLPGDPGYHDLLAIFEPVLKRDPKTESVGLAASGGFVVRAFAGGPAAKAGLRRGDLIVSQTEDGMEVVLEVQSRQDGEPRTVRLTPRFISPKEEWLEDQRAESRVIEHRGKRIAYAPLWSCAGSEHQDLLEESLQGDFADADALVIDFRGGWGGCDPALVRLFDPAAPELIRIDRNGTRTSYSPSWRKPVAVLIDGGSRSGKEVVSRALQRARRARLVGERTAGAVVAGQINLLSDGSLLYLAVQDIEVNGERLEGVGVQPDVRVPAGLEWAEGRDPQLERALDLLSHS